MQLESRVPSGPLAQKWDKHRFDMKLVNPANKRKYKVLVVGTGIFGHPHGIPAAIEELRRIANNQNV